MDHLAPIHEAITQMHGKDSIVAIVGTKCDLHGQPLVTVDDVSARFPNAAVYMLSAKSSTAADIRRVFADCVGRVVDPQSTSSFSIFKKRTKL